MPPHEKSRPEGSEAAIQQVGETGSILPLGWHNMPEPQWHYEAGYADGYAAGRADAERAIAEEISQATGVRPYSSRAVIRWLCRCIDLDQRRSEPYSSTANGTDLGVAERDLLGRWAA